MPICEPKERAARLILTSIHTTAMMANTLHPPGRGCGISVVVCVEKGAVLRSLETARKAFLMISAKEVKVPQKPTVRPMKPWMVERLAA